MKLAVVGSRSLNVSCLEDFIPSDVDEIVSGGAAGVDTCAREYARRNGKKLTEFFPDYKRYGKLAPLYRNIQIIEYADEVIAFWDGKSTGTKYVIDNCMKTGRKIRVFRSK